MAPTSTSPTLPPLASLPLMMRDSETERLPLLPTVHRDHATVVPLDPKPVSSKEPPHELLGLALVAVSAVCFSIVTTLVKYETRNGLSSMETIFWRSSVAFILNRITMAYKRVGTFVPYEERQAMLLQCFFGFGCIAFGFYAISRMVLADASVLIFLSPVLTFFLGSLFLDEHIDRVSLGCALFSILGVVCVLRPTILFGDHDDSTSIPPTFAVVSALLAATTLRLRPSSPECSFTGRCPFLCAL